MNRRTALKVAAAGAAALVVPASCKTPSAEIVEPVDKPVSIDDLKLGVDKMYAALRSSTYWQEAHKLTIILPHHLEYLAGDMREFMLGADVLVAKAPGGSAMELFQ